MQGVSSALIARNESWVRQQAGAMMRHLPSNVEKADLIQVGLIGVAQAALAFKWEGDTDSVEAKEAFVRYARQRVKGAMLDELRQMDQLDRSQRRKVKIVQIARERWLARHGVRATLGELSTLCGMSMDELSALEHAALMVQTEGLAEEADEPERGSLSTPATPGDEVEARVDTAIVMRRLERFFVQMPERERQVIDAYLGVGLTPAELADTLQVSTSRLSRMYRVACDRIVKHMGHGRQRSLDRLDTTRDTPMDELVARREVELAAPANTVSWPQVIERTLTMPEESFGTREIDGRIVLDKNTRWG